MTLPSSGQLSLSMIKAEFSGVNAFSGYYKGGGYVPNTAANANIPTSGLMRISNFYGASADTTVIALTDKYITAELTGVNAYAGFRMASAGKLRARQGNSFSTYDEITPYNEWADPEATDVGSLYECYAYVATGSAPSGPLGTWTALSTAPTWELIRSTAGTSNCTLTILIRKIGTTTTLASANIYLTATQIAAFTPVTVNYTTVGSFTETAPTGATNVVIEVWGGGAQGMGVSKVATKGGAGGAAGGYSKSSYAISGGQTLNLTVGAGGDGGGTTTPVAGGASSCSSGSKSITTMTANGGTGSSTGGVGGAASGGNQANGTGNAGSTAYDDVGGAPGDPNDGGQYLAGQGGWGADASGVIMVGQGGGRGMVRFYYT